MGPEHPQRPAQIALDERRHGRAEISLDRRRLFGEGAEDHAAEGLDAELLQAMVLDVEILRHAALAAQAVAEGYC
jgi:hypothetical protein